jgi:hypothetical protein
MRLFFVVFSLLISSKSILAQGPPPGVGRSSDVPSDTIPQEELDLDTINHSYFFPDNPSVIFPEKDSLLSNYFQHFDPARRRSLDYYHLGNINSAAYPSVFQPILRRGLDMGIHQYDLYRIRNNEVRFYKQTKAFSDLFYSGAQQEDALIETHFGRNFANGVNFSLSYKRGNNISVRNFPSVQGLRHSALPTGRNTAFATGVWIHRPRYDGYFTYTAFNVSQNDRGGVRNDTLIDAPESVKRASSGDLLASLTDAATRQEVSEFNYLHYLTLNKKDSTGQTPKRSYLATHQVLYRKSLYRFTDPFGTVGNENVKPRVEDSLYYGSLITDLRGMRFVLIENLVENQFSLSTTRVRNKPIDNEKDVPSAQNDWFEVGLTHSFHAVNQEVDSSKRRFNNILLRGRWHFSPNDNFKIQTYGQFNAVGYNIGDYQLRGDLFFNLKNIGNLTVKAVSQLYEPSWVQQQAFVMRQRVWNNDFGKTLETHISGTLGVPRLGFEGAAAFTLLNNYVYFDSTAQPRQASTPLSIFQVIVQENLKLSVFHLDNTLAFQQPTESFVQLPTLTTKHSLYYEGKIFKKVMLVRLGFDVRYNSAWFAPQYMPLTGQFLVQNRTQVQAYPAVDGFLAMKVKSFRFFARFDNITSFVKKGAYFQTLRYPFGETANVRFGIRWQLLN